MYEILDEYFNVFLSFGGEVAQKLSQNLSINILILVCS